MSSTQVLVSPKYQIVIPKEVREMMKIRPGQKMEVIAYGNSILLVPVIPIKKARGMFKGINTTIESEPDKW
jgi:AbrB family looped-hinge helix DNA binding protein